MTDEPTSDAPGQPNPAAPQSPPATSQTRQNRSAGLSLALVGGLALVLVLMIGAGAMFALSIGPFARPTPTLVSLPSTSPPPPPTATPRPSATPAPTLTPAASATASAGPSATPIPSGDVVAVLLSHIPSAIASSCTTTLRDGAILAKAKCSAANGAIDVTYLQYADFDSMFAAYESFRLATQIEPNTGNCNNPQSWPAESDFAIGGQPSGRFLCTEALGGTSIYWTDNRLNILSQATDTESDHARLVDFWAHDSGPNL